MNLLSMASIASIWRTVKIQQTFQTIRMPIIGTQEHILCHSSQNLWQKVTLIRLTFSSLNEISPTTRPFCASGRLPSATQSGARGIIEMPVSRPLFIYFPQYVSGGVPIVWESNRSGRSHIYSRFILMPLGDVHDENSIAKHFELLQNFPNPFNPSTVIRFQLSTTAAVTLKIFDVLGREIQTLIEQKLTAGDYRASWDGTRFASGVYFCRLQAGDFVQTKKLLLLK